MAHAGRKRPQEAGTEDEPPKKLPSFAQYFEDPSTPYNRWFYVGNPKKMTPERIGVNDLNLMAHSEVLRRMLYESPLAETGPVKLIDITPHTFRLFLRFVNGYHDFSHILTMEEGVDLLCVAEKYLVDELKMKLGEWMTQQLTLDNVFALMNKKESYQHQVLKEAIDKMITENTKKLMSKEGFLQLNSTGILTLVSQSSLSVCELELWRSLLRWAKHQAGCNDKVTLREVIEEPLRYIRFCTLEEKIFSKEVSTAGVLTDQEIASVVKTFGGQTDCVKSEFICYELEARTKNKANQKITISALEASSFKPSNIKPTDVVHEMDFLLSDFQDKGNDTCTTYFYITTDSKPVLLLNGQLKPITHNFRCAPRKLTFPLQCTITLLRITNYADNTSTEEPKTFVAKKTKAKYNATHYVDFAQELRLEPQSKYFVQFTFSHSFPQYWSTQDRVIESCGACGRMIVSWMQGAVPGTHFRSLKYKLL